MDEKNTSFGCKNASIFETAKNIVNKSSGYLSGVLFFAALLLLDVFFRLIISEKLQVYSAQDIVPVLFSSGWCILLSGIVFLLPGTARRIYMSVTGFIYIILTAVHNVFVNMFGRFFSFKDIVHAENGAAFFDSSYLGFSAAFVVLVVVCAALVVFSVLLVPKEACFEPKKGSIITVAGILIILAVRLFGIGFYDSDDIVWDQTSNKAFLYEDFTDTVSCYGMLGTYQYTFKDISGLISFGGGISASEKKQLDEYVNSRTHNTNSMTDVFKGKNLILIQLEAIDTWMLTEEYMPTLYFLKQHGIVFENHYTPVYVTGGTFNTEFMVNTGLMPAMGNTSVSVYTKNTFSNSIASLFKKVGYRTRSFHGSEANVYNRGAIHENLGYEKYYSGSDMGMWDFQFDSALMSGYYDIVDTETDNPFFSFIITYSGHGPYGEDNRIGQLHMDKAISVAERTDGNYLYAVAHAMETDEFIRQFVAQLGVDGFMENTVLVFYADHYNYYMVDDELVRDIKGVDTYNKQAHTDFFIYDCGRHIETQKKVTSSLDVLPTLANMFGLDADYRYLLGEDAYNGEEGVVFFPDNSWFDGKVWSKKLREEWITTKEVSQTILAGDVLAGKNKK